MTMCRANPQTKRPHPPCDHSGGRVWTFPEKGNAKCACGRCGVNLMVIGDKWVEDTPDNRAASYDYRNKL